jgi:hypothetical protein
MQSAVWDAVTAHRRSILVGAIVVVVAVVLWVAPVPGADLTAAGVSPGPTGVGESVTPSSSSPLATPSPTTRLVSPQPSSPESTPVASPAGGPAIAYDLVMSGDLDQTLLGMAPETGDTVCFPEGYTTEAAVSMVALSLPGNDPPFALTVLDDDGPGPIAAGAIASLGPENGGRQYVWNAEDPDMGSGTVSWEEDGLRLNITLVELDAGSPLALTGRLRCRGS